MAKLSDGEFPVGPMRKKSVAAQQYGEEFPDGHDWYGQVLQWRTRLWLHQARRRRPRCVRSHHRGGARWVEGSDRRAAHHIRGRTGQEGQRPQGGQPGDFVLKRLGSACIRIEALVFDAFSSREPVPTSLENAMKKIPAAESGREVAIKFLLVAIRSDSSRRRAPV